MAIRRSTTSVVAERAAVEAGAKYARWEKAHHQRQGPLTSSAESEARTQQCRRIAAFVRGYVAEWNREPETEQDRIDAHVAEQQARDAAAKGDPEAQAFLGDPPGGDVLFASLTYRGQPITTEEQARVACTALGVGLLTGPAWETNDAANGCWNVVAKAEHVAHLLRTKHLLVIAGLFALHAEAP